MARICSMDGQPNIGGRDLSTHQESVLAEARQAFEELALLLPWGRTDVLGIRETVVGILFGLGRVLTRLMLVHRHSRLSRSRILP